MRFLRSLTVVLFLGCLVPLAAEDRGPGLYRVIKAQSLPIQWEGRVIGQLVLPVGKEIEVVKVEGGVHTCRNANQTFTLMGDCLEPVVPPPPPAPMVTMPAPAPAVLPSSATGQTVESPPAPSPPPLRPPNWDPVESYLAEVERHLASTDLNARYFQYGKLGRFSGRQIRPQVRQWKSADPSDARVIEARALDAALTSYDRGLWTQFEKELRVALAARGARLKN